jgi:hypothetical protein
MQWRQVELHADLGQGAYVPVIEYILAVPFPSVSTADAVNCRRFR